MKRLKVKGYLLTLQTSVYDVPPADYGDLSAVDTEEMKKSILQ